MSKAKRTAPAETRGRVGKAALPKPEFSRPVDVSRMGRLEQRLEIAATEDERAALARRFDLVALPLLAAELVLRKRGDGVIELTGRWRARVAQRCVVTLEPVWSTMEDAVRLFFGGTLGTPPADRDPLDEEGWPEPIEGGRIDVGEAVAQLMALALDPYPRRPDDSRQTTDDG